MKKIDKGYRIFKKAVSSDTSKSLFIAFNETINFVTQKNKKFKPKTPSSGTIAPAPIIPII